MRVLSSAGRKDGAEVACSRHLAEAFAPADRMTRTKFRELVDEALEGIPKRFRDAMKNIAIVIEDEPTVEDLEEVGVEPPDTLLGLYQGTPLTERQWAHGNVLPDKITLFKGPIEDSSEDEDDIVVAIGETLIHEVGHYFGLSEEEIEEIEERYWRGDGDEEDDEGDNEEDEDDAEDDET